MSLTRTLTHDEICQAIKTRLDLEGLKIEGEIEFKSTPFMANPGMIITATANVTTNPKPNTDWGYGPGR